MKTSLKRVVVAFTLLLLSVSAYTKERDSLRAFGIYAVNKTGSSYSGGLSWHPSLLLDWNVGASALKHTSGDIFPIAEIGGTLDLSILEVGPILQFWFLKSTLFLHYGAQSNLFFSKKLFLGYNFLISTETSEPTHQAKLEITF